MPDPTDPPRPALRTSVHGYISNCVWNQQFSRVETSTGDPVYAWLNQAGTPAISATVLWEAGTETNLGPAVPATIPYDSWVIISNGSFDSSTGLVTYDGKSYRFKFVMVSGTATMAPYG